MKQVFELQLPALLYFVKESCHANLHEALNELKAIASEVQKNGQHETIPKELPLFLKSFIKKIKLHLAIEENHFFPMIHSGRNQSGSIDHLVDDHDHIKDDLLQLRSMTHNYQLIVGGSDLSVRLYKKLMEMDRIVLNHIQIEDNVLFPMVLNCS